MIEEDLPEPAGVTAGEPIDLEALAAALTGSRGQLSVLGGLANDFDLASLAEVLPLVTSIFFPSGVAFRGFDALRSATRLRSVTAYNGLQTSENVDWRSLAVESFQGYLNAPLHDLASSPSLHKLVLYDLRSPAPFRFGPSVRVIDLWESPKLHRMPDFERPDSLEELTVRPTRGFDLSTFSQYENLADLRLMAVRDLQNLEALTQLRALRFFYLDECTSEEDWSILLGLPSAATVEVVPSARQSTEFLDAGEERGWIIRRPSKRQGSAAEGPIRMLKLKGETLISLDDFTAFDDAVERLGLDVLVNGYFVEHVLMAPLAEVFPELRSQVEVDSEGDLATFRVKGTQLAKNLTQAWSDLLSDPMQLDTHVKKAAHTYNG